MPKLRLLSVATPGYSVLVETEELPSDVTVADGYWYYRGGQFKIGVSVRAPEDGEFEGPVFLYNPDNPAHCEKLRWIQAEVAESGKLVIN